MLCIPNGYADSDMMISGRDTDRGGTIHMEITMLSDTEMRVFLTEDELLRFSLDCSFIDCDDHAEGDILSPNEDTRRALRAILDEAREQTGFDTERERVLIRIQRRGEGGCALFFSKQTQQVPADISQQAPSALIGSSGRVCVLYSFDDCLPQTFIELCRILQDRGFSGESAAYVLCTENKDTARFYLALWEERYGAGRERTVLPIPRTAILEEFGKRITASSMLSCLSEHARCIAASGAVEWIAALPTIRA